MFQVKYNKDYMQSFQKIEINIYYTQLFYIINIQNGWVRLNFIYKIDPNLESVTIAYYCLY